MDHTWCHKHTASDSFVTDGTAYK